jgi:FkbM family methyltransferase
MNKTLIRARSAARKLGLLSGLKRVHSLFSRGYERRFDAALLSHIEPGDVIWDVGANVGLYTEKFLARTGPEGKVVAFEPAPACFDVLSQKFKHTTNVILEPAALSSSNTTGLMRMASDPLGATHQLMDDGTADGGASVPVTVLTADAYVEGSKNIPNVIKIDVEGFEYDVFQGMKTLLGEPKLRAIFCEIHFALLEKRGQAFTPIEIERLLRHARFDVKYTDSSHIQAIRSSCQQVQRMVESTQHGSV